MNALLLAAMLAAGPPPPAPAERDLRCYRLMAELSRAEDASVRTLGIAAAQYFLGRIDAAAPGYDLAGVAAVGEGERPALIRRCAAALNASGFDLRALGRSPAAPEPTI